MTRALFAVAFCALMAASAARAQQAVPEQGTAPTNLEQKEDGHWTANGVPPQTEGFQVHVVARGDTLWAIAGRYLEDPFLWPQIWEANGQIVNPHWIYPEDQILIRPVTQITEVAPPPAPPAPEPPPPPEPAEPRQVQLPNLPLSSQSQGSAPENRFVFRSAEPPVAPEVKASDLYCSGFVTTRDLPSARNVMATFSEENRIVSTSGQYIYIRSGSASGVAPGDVLTVVRPTREIRSTRDGIGGLGRHYLELGQVEAVTVQPEFSLARVVHSCGAIEVGDLVTAFQKIDFPSLPADRSFRSTMPSSGKTTGAIAMARDSLSNFKSRSAGGTGIVPGMTSSHLGNLSKGIVGEGQIVYVDLGVRDGVQPGNLFLIYRPLDLSHQVGKISGDAKRLLADERIVLGELVVLKVEERAATALVTFSAGGVAVGDLVELR